MYQHRPEDLRARLLRAHKPVEFTVLAAHDLPDFGGSSDNFALDLSEEGAIECVGFAIVIGAKPVKGDKVSCHLGDHYTPTCSKL